MKGLLKLPYDPRDFKSHKVLGTPKLELPDEYILPKMFPIQDQGGLPFCFAHAICSASEEQEGVKLSEETQAVFSYELLGGINPQGCDLRNACKSAVKTGSCEKSKVTLPSPKTLAVLGDKKSYNEFELAQAYTHKKKTYLAVTGPYDLFDNIRNIIWQRRNDRVIVITGCNFPQWLFYENNGVVPNVTLSSGTGHAFVVRGWKMINNVLHLVVQLSNGSRVGDNGYLYFPREVVNREFAFGNYILIDLDPNEAKQASWSSIIKMWDIILKNYELIKNTINKTVASFVSAFARDYD